jgi:hypothetical protein
LCATLLQPIPIGQEHGRGGFFGLFNRGFGRTAAWYERGVARMLPKAARYLVIYLAIIGAAVFLYQRLPTSFLPNEDQGTMLVNVQLPPGATQERTRAVIQQVDPLLRSSGHVEAGPAERVRTAICRVVLGHDRIKIALRAEACDPGRVSEPTDGTVTITVRLSLQRQNGALLIVPDEQDTIAPPHLDHHLVRSVCLARDWRRRLETGEVASTRELASIENLCHRHTGRLLPLAWLAPDLVAMILEGRQPRTMSLQSLTERPLPRLWDDQRRLVAQFG